jgi:3-oxoacyl-(acyl-carrier-protein) synthase
MASVFSVLPPFCSMKRSLGHTLAASGALEGVFSVCALREGVIPATAGFGEADEKIGATPSIMLRTPLNAILKTSFGFGGNNAAMIFTRAGEGN